MTSTDAWTRLVTRVLAPNAGPMTLDGTNSLILRDPTSPAVIVVDPGPADAAHVARLTTHGPVELILLTHHHADHVEAAEALAAKTGAVVRARDPQLCVRGAPLADSERIVAAGVTIDVVAIPGHTADSVGFFLPDDSVDGADARGSMITGDTILGRGTTIIAHPDGSVSDFLATLARLETFGDVMVLPAHGPALPDLAAVCQAYRAHRLERLGQVRVALGELGTTVSTDDDTVRRVVDAVYADIDPAVRFAAEASTRAQLAFLADFD